MKRIDQFRKELDELLERFSDLSYEEIANELDYYSVEYMNKVNK